MKMTHFFSVIQQFINSILDLGRDGLSGLKYLPLVMSIGIDTGLVCPGIATRASVIGRVRELGYTLPVGSRFILKVWRTFLNRVVIEGLLNM